MGVPGDRGRQRDRGKYGVGRRIGWMVKRVQERCICRSQSISGLVIIFNKRKQKGGISRRTALEHGVTSPRPTQNWQIVDE